MGHSIRDFRDFVAFLNQHYTEIMMVIVLTVIVVALVWAGVVVLMGWWSVKTADREQYQICDKHGAIRDTDMLTLIEGGINEETGAYEEPIRMCPVCYTERGKEAYAKLVK